MKLSKFLIITVLVLALTAVTVLALALTAQPAAANPGVDCYGVIGGTVWCDADGDGELDAGEAGIEGVKVTLENSWGYTATTHTDANGKYEFAALEVAPGVFEGLCADDYTVTVDPATLPAGLVPTYDYDGIGTLHTAEVTLPNYNSVIDSVDFGYTGCCAGVLVGIEVNKSGPTFGYVGDAPTYEYEVSNVGNAPLTDVSVSDDKCGAASYVSGDDGNNKLDPDEAWTFNCTYTPGFTFPGPLVNTATASGDHECGAVEDTDDYTLYPFILRKKLFLYWDSPANTVPYTVPDDTPFEVQLKKDGTLLDTFSISQSTPKNLWLSEGSYQFCEVNLPLGYLAGYECINHTTGLYPDWTHINAITFDLAIDKWGPDRACEGETITYFYEVTNAGPASVKPVVSDDICGTPTFTGGDTDGDGLIDPDETWTYECQYTVGTAGTTIVNVATVDDAANPHPESGKWLLGGDRDLTNNTDDWSVTPEVCVGVEFGSIGDFVWHDLFHSQYHQVDGIQDNGEPGINGVVVELRDSYGNVVTTTTTTDSPTTGLPGWYEFADLDAGTYTVKVADSNFEPGAVLDGWYASPPDRGDDALDSDGNATTHQATVTLATGEHNPTIDFGFFHTCIDLQKTGPVSVTIGANVTYHFVVINCGDLVHHGGAHVYDPLISLYGYHEIWNGVVWPGEVYEFDRTYTPSRDDCGELVNTATAVGHPKHPDGYYVDNVTDQASWTVIVECEPGGGQGCTPGYWKQKQHFDSWVTYKPGDWYNRVFEVRYYKTLLKALATGGGGEKALGRHAVAALLNAANPDINYLYTVDEVISMVQQAYATRNFEGVKNLFEAQNEAVCPLD